MRVWAFQNDDKANAVVGDDKLVVGVMGFSAGEIGDGSGKPGWDDDVVIYKSRR